MPGLVEDYVKQEKREEKEFWTKIFETLARLKLKCLIRQDIYEDPIGWQELGLSRKEAYNAAWSLADEKAYQRIDQMQTEQPTATFQALLFEYQRRRRKDKC